MSMRCFALAGLAAAACLSSPVVRAQTPAAAPAPSATHLTVAYQEFTLPNGLHVILHRDTSVPVVAVNVWYHVGSGQREGRPHRLRAPVRAPDVRRLEARARRVVRHLARGRRRQQQRLHQHRPHQLLHRRPGQRARPDAVPRIGPHGLPARHDEPGARRRPARRGQERAAPELREPALRHGRARARHPAVARRAIPTAGRRLARWRT